MYNAVIEMEHMIVDSNPNYFTLQSYIVFTLIHLVYVWGKKWNTGK